ncbi:hypothetical protein BU23DRAFT_569770 [Bimuria novae-zelandiae CBS 107.79]|uniref:Uncharacterized protein n=1 Tax=Bimuria novae-zelandiae CBS 107.79 TaxID=1447943 RepID=A0A6A5VEE3_9PLEO|nr:hypothetical protein BU23DRAFT_569770 [Bimuria novae-zelandiae CBS 107.79]
MVTGEESYEMSNLGTISLPGDNRYWELNEMRDEVVTGEESYEMCDLKAETTGLQVCGSADGRDATREPADLPIWPLHKLIPGLEFLPGIDDLNNTEVFSVRVEYEREPRLPSQTNIDANDEVGEEEDDEDLGEIYQEYESFQTYVADLSFGANMLQQSDMSVLHPGEQETMSRPRPYYIGLYNILDHPNEPEMIYFYNTITGHQTSFTAMNHLLVPDVEEAEPQIHRDEPDYLDPDVEVTEIVKEIKPTRANLADFTFNLIARIEEYKASAPEDRRRRMFWRPVNALVALGETSTLLKYPSYTWLLHGPNTLECRDIIDSLTNELSYSPVGAEEDREDAGIEDGISFAGLTGMVKTLTTRRTNFLDDEDESEQDTLNVKKLPRPPAGPAEPPVPPSEFSVDSVSSFDATTQTLAEFTEDYVAQMRRGNAHHMQVTRATILEDYDAEGNFQPGVPMHEILSWIQGLYSLTSAAVIRKSPTLAFRRELRATAAELAQAAQDDRQDNHVDARLQHRPDHLANCVD